MIALAVGLAILAGLVVVGALAALDVLLEADGR